MTFVKTSVILLAIFAVLMIFFSVSYAQNLGTPSEQGSSGSAEKPSFDSQSLVGKWEGEWGHTRAGGYLYCDIKRIVGNEVIGVLYIQSSYRTPSYLNRDLDFKGMITNNGISAVIGGFMTLNLTMVKQNRMEGNLMGSIANSQVWLEKKIKR